MRPSYDLARATDELNQLLDLYPHLTDAFRAIRQTRPARYFQIADQLVLAWANALCLKDRIELIAGTNLSGIDFLFEGVSAVDYIDRLYQDFAALGDYEKAADFLREIGAPTNLEDAVKIHVAFITAAGYHRLYLASGPKMAHTWCNAWRQKLCLHLSQEATACGISLQPNSYFPPSFATIGDAVRNYATDFAYTGALSMSIVSSLPFSYYYDQDLLDGVCQLTDCLEPLYRLIQDSYYDPKENLNLGLFITAGQHQLSVADAKVLLAAQRDLVADLEAKLRAEIQVYFASAKFIVAETLSAYRDAAAYDPLAALGKTLLDIAARLAVNIDTMHQ